MKTRTVLILWILALVLGISVYALKKSQGGEQKNVTERKAGETLVPDFPAEETESIKVSGANKTVTLNKKDGTWRVSERDDFPADTRKINDLLRTLKNLEVTQGVEAGPSFAPRFGMDRKSSNPAKHGITVSFQNSSGAELAKLSFGKTLDAASSSPFGGGGSTGRYIRNHDDKSGFYVVSELFSSLSADPKDWLANEFFEIEKIKTVSLTKPGSDEAEWTLTRDDEDAEFRFSDAFPGVKADPAAVTPLKSLFSYARFDDLVPSAKAKKIWDTEKLQKATVSTFEGLTYRLSLQPAKAPKGKATSENYLFSVDVSGELPEERKKPEGEDEKTAEAADKAFDERRSSLSKSLEQARKLEGITFEVSKSSISALLKNRTELMNKGPGPHSATPSQSGNTAFSPPISIPMHPDSEESDE